MSASPPSLSPEQRRAALEKAAEARRVRSDIKARLKSGQLSFAALMDEAEHDPMVARLKVRTALESLPGLGKVHARRLMIELEIADSRRLKGLGPRQLEGLFQHPKITA